MELNNNKLTGEELEKLINKYPKLYKLKIEENAIESIDDLKCLSKLEELKKINVQGNPFCEKNENYKDEIFKILGKIITVDSQTKEGNKIDSTISDEDDEEFGEIEDDEFIEEDDEEGKEYNDEDGEDDGDDEDDDEEDENPRKKQKK